MKQILHDEDHFNFQQVRDSSCVFSRTARLSATDSATPAAILPVVFRAIAIFKVAWALAHAFARDHKVRGLKPTLRVLQLQKGNCPATQLNLDDELADEILRTEVLLQRLPIREEIDNRVGLRRKNSAAEIFLEFFHQYWNPLVSSTAVANGVFDGDSFRGAAIAKPDLDRISDGPFGGVEIVASELRVFDDLHFLAQRVDARIGGGIFVVVGRQRTTQQWNGHHVLKAMISIGRIVERTRLIDDSLAALLRLDQDLFDFV